MEREQSWDIYGLGIIRQLGRWMDVKMGGDWRRKTWRRMDSQWNEGGMPNLGSRWILQQKDCPVCVRGRVDILLHQDSKGNEGEIFWSIQGSKCIQGRTAEIVCFTQLDCSLLSVLWDIKWHTKVGCDNFGAIKVSKRRLRRIRPSMSCADILRNIKRPGAGWQQFPSISMFMATWRFFWEMIN